MFCTYLMSFGIIFPTHSMSIGQKIPDGDKISWFLLSVALNCVEAIENKYCWQLLFVSTLLLCWTAKCWQPSESPIQSYLLQYISWYLKLFLGISRILSPLAPSHCINMPNNVPVPLWLYPHILLNP